MTQDECDREYLDVLEQEHAKLARKGKPAKNPPAVWTGPKRVDRRSPRWRRMRASLCPEHGLPEELDEYCDRVYKLVPR